MTRQTTLEKPTRDADVIYATAQMLLRELCFGESALLADGRGIRLIGVGVSKLDEGGYEQTDLFDWMKTQEEEKEKKQQAAERQQKTEQLDRMMENIQARFGKKSLQKGITERGTE